MGFAPLLGNDRLKDNLSGALRRGRISHFYLISGPAGSGKQTLTQLLAAAAMCSGNDKPCQTCPACRKVLSGVHPDVITVDDPEKKTVPVDLIRRAREDMFIRPNEGQHKVYLIPRAQDLGLPGQNALLKVLEEPPSYGIFLLLTDNPEKLLPTVRSRCVELTLQPLSRDVLLRQLNREFPDAAQEAIEAAITRSGGYLGQAKQLLSEGDQTSAQTVQFTNALASRNELELTLLLASMEKWKREQLLSQLQQWLEITEGAFACRAGMAALSPLSAQLATGCNAPTLRNATEILRKAMEYAQANVSVAAICGWLAREL